MIMKMSSPPEKKIPPKSDFAMADSSRDPASFRDPEGYVFFRDGVVYRTLSPEALSHWQAFRNSQAAASLFESGVLVQSREVEECGKVLLEHNRVPLISYSYEWPFDMLKDAAILTLDLIEQLLKDGFVLKDATPFNVQFVGSRPVFVDIGSVVRYEESSGWVGYAQFIETFIYPLMINAIRGNPFQPLVRSYIDGLPVEFMRSLFGWLDVFNPGVFSNVLLRRFVMSRTRRGLEGGSRDRKSDPRVPKEIVLNNVRRFSRLVRKLSFGGEESVWKDYTETRTYSEADVESKKTFVEDILRKKAGVVWDLGANTGEFSVAAAAHASQVVAVEMDHVAANIIYRGIKDRNISNVNVIVDDIANPAPSMGFGLRERKSLFARSRPDIVLALALIHHLVLTRSIPMDFLVSWMQEICHRWIVEFVHEDDPMAEFLRNAKRGRTHKYNRQHFEDSISRLFRIKTRLELKDVRRTLYLVEANPGV